MTSMATSDPSALIHDTGHARPIPRPLRPRPAGIVVDTRTVAVTIVTQRGPVSLSVSDAGEGPPVVLAHGLTATRRYVVMGSSALARMGTG